jgi:hypothetical protein
MSLSRLASSAALAGLAATAAFAWQGLTGTLGWTEQDKGVIVRQGLLEEGMFVLPGTFQLKQAVKTAWIARPAVDRVALVKELTAAAKAYVMTPGFEKTYDEWIRQRFNAVNHGIVADPNADMRAMMKPGAAENMMAQAAGQVAASYMKMPVQTLQMLFPTDLKSWQSSRDPKMQKLYARGKAIEPLMRSNPEEFKKQYALLKSVEMGGPDSLAGIESAKAAGAQTQADMKKKQEQRAYDEHRFKATLKKRLGEFAALARTVDFAAQTQTKEGKIVFVNPAYERKSRAWKQLFRIGREPVMAAVAATEAWMKEL